MLVDPAPPDGTIKSHRSLVITDVEILETFSFEAVMTALAGQAGNGVTATSLFRDWWSTQNFGNVLKDNCRETPFFTAPQFPYCSRAEGKLMNDNPFSSGDTGFEAIGLFNRIDLAAEDGSDCGEYRIVFARRSGTSHANERLLINFEAILPSPSGTHAGCKPIAEFWRRLTDITSPAERARKLRRFYFDGHIPGFPPVVHIDNYGARKCPASDPPRPCPTGQIRTNQFMDTPWALGEFVMTRNPAVRIVPERVGDTPFGVLFCCESVFVTPQLLRQFRAEFISAIPGLAITDPLRARYLPTLDPTLNAARALSAPAETTNYLREFYRSPTATFRGEIAMALSTLPKGSALTPDDIVARAQGLSCSGCHHLNNRLSTDYPNQKFAPLWPASLGFEHVTERETELDEEGRRSFKTSDALKDALPRREGALRDILAR
jgi:hypothetical protein